MVTFIIFIFIVGYVAIAFKQRIRWLAIIGYLAGAAIYLLQHFLTNL